jgi:hypothetical protein
VPGTAHRCLRLVEQVVEPGRLLLNDALRRSALVVPMAVAMPKAVVRGTLWPGDGAVVCVRRRRRRERAARRQQRLLLELRIRHHHLLDQTAHSKQQICEITQDLSEFLALN